MSDPTLQRVCEMFTYGRVYIQMSGYRYIGMYTAAHIIIYVLQVYILGPKICELQRRTISKFMNFPVQTSQDNRLLKGPYFLYILSLVTSDDKLYFHFTDVCVYKSLFYLLLIFFIMKCFKHRKEVQRIAQYSLRSIENNIPI